MPEIVYRLDHNVAVVTFSNPPVNGLSHALRMGIADALARAQSDGSARGIVLTGADGLFSGGADIREFGTPASTAEPTLRRLIELVETSVKPVVASITGPCLGGGLELAMAAHHRVVSAERKARPARGEARPPAGRGRHPATAAPGRRRAGDRDDRGRRAGTSRRSCGNPARRSRSRRRPATRGRGARGHGGGAPPQSP